MIWLIKKPKADLRLSIPQKQNREYKIHRSELIDGEKFMYTREDIMMPMIMHYRVSNPKVTEFKTRLGFN